MKTINDVSRLRFRCSYVLLAAFVIASIVGLIFSRQFKVSLRETAAIQKQETRSPQQQRFGDERPAIVALVSNESKDLFDLCCALKSITAFFNDNSTAPGLIFNENNLEEYQRSFITTCAHPRSVYFPTVDFQSFPSGFDHDKEKPYMTKRSDWGYNQMCRFWISTIWKHSAIQEYTTVMRLDSDSCYTKHFSGDKDKILPCLANDKVYFASDTNHFDEKHVIDGLWDLAVDYVGRNNLTDKIAFPALWEKAKQLWTKNESLPTFFNNFEVTRKSFMQRPDVARWHEAVSEHEPFGVFRGRWGDAPVRFLTMAMFATPDQVIRDNPPIGYLHNGRARRECVEPHLQATTALYAQMKSNEESHSLTKKKVNNK